MTIAECLIGVRRIDENAEVAWERTHIIREGVGPVHITILQTAHNPFYCGGHESANVISVAQRLADPWRQARSAQGFRRETVQRGHSTYVSYVTAPTTGWII